MSSSSAPSTTASAAEERSARVAVTLFPLLILAGGAVALAAPAAFSGLSPWINPLLGIIMFGMGLTLTPPDFAIIAKRPVPVVIGVVAQYAIMPFLGWLVAMALSLPPALAAGVILVGCCPGGTASNVVSYLAKGDVALSVAMTSVSTLIAPLLTPVLALWLAGQYMPVDAGSMAWSIVQIVLLPVLLGLVIRLFLPRLVNKALPALPWISVIAITFVVIAVVSGSAKAIFSAGLLVLVAVILHNGLGYALGYGAARLFRLPVPARRTTAIEVGMQNSGLAAGLARTYMTPEAALPGAIFSVWHNVSGAVLAAYWRRRSTPAPSQGEKVPAAVTE
ncbi:bile acid:sodium symporter family protein [Pseudarthrobacter sulfonivorans]|uniref:bile acid:sodium symporter family protein n=1 Tax=Pseudarthrobacter sulfonivorans TaxID=121292 RepID=UPI0027804C0E|nr:bile acid:sodium symporter family protein [Pseudarthrobacter sulfonivorans]MDP9998327.1 BASS family bile acid:Na+ symporter [Pseudarthrobacter sulfonivorans]